MGHGPEPRARVHARLRVCTCARGRQRQGGSLRARWGVASGDGVPGHGPERVPTGLPGET